MVKMVLTSDWLLGMRFPGFGEVAGRLREERSRAVERVLGLAEANGADLVLVAGNAFADNGVAKEVVDLAMDLLERHDSVPVTLVPGRRDRLGPTSIYLSETWISRRPDHVRVLTSQRPEVVEGTGVTLHPWPVGMTPGSPPEAVEERSRAEGPFRVGVVPRGVFSSSGAGSSPRPPVPFRGETTMDLVVRGESEMRSWPEDRTIAPGTPEPFSFVSTSPGQVVLVDTGGGAGGGYDHQALPTGRLRWVFEEVEAFSREDVSALINWMSELPGPERTLIQLRVRGSGPVNLLASLTGLAECCGDLLVCRVDTSPFRPIVGGEVPHVGGSRTVTGRVLEELLGRVLEDQRSVLRSTVTGASKEGGGTTVERRALEIMLDQLGVEGA